jgi:hypothetical protein
MSTHGLRLGLALACTGALLSAARAVTVKIDYEYDANFFFSHGNPGGPAAGDQARVAVEAAAAYFSGILEDTLDAIQVPAPFTSMAGSNVTWHWTMDFRHPATDAPQSQAGGFFPADEYRIFVGAQSFPGATLGVGSIGTSNPFALGTVAPADTSQVNQIDAAFKSLVKKRGETSGFASWGGAISFDRDADAPWSYSLAGPAAGANDFYSVALHEMAHALGFGTSAEWMALASGEDFAGLAAQAAYGGVAPPLVAPAVDDPYRSHWTSDVESTIYSTNIAQQAAMTPQLTTGTRKRFTAVDAAALADIGWEVAPPAFHPADFNADGAVDAADFASWKSAFGTGPAGAADSDDDGDSDGADFLAWQRARGVTSTPTAAPVPEPTALALLLWLAPLVAKRRARSPSLEGRG